MPTSFPADITSSAPTPLSAIFSIAPYTVSSGVTDHTSPLLLFNTIPTVPLILVIIGTHSGKGLGAGEMQRAEHSPARNKKSITGPSESLAPSQSLRLPKRAHHGHHVSLIRIHSRIHLAHLLLGDLPRQIRQGPAQRGKFLQRRIAHNRHCVVRRKIMPVV